MGEVGGNTLGLYGGLFSPQGDLILAHGYHGAFHLWKRVSETDQSEDSLELWCPLPTLSGHFGPVCDIAWEPERGAFLVSISADQTARLISPWQQEGGKVRETGGKWSHNKATFPSIILLFSVHGV